MASLNNDEEEALKVVVFTKEAQNFCVNFMKKTLKLKVLATKLKGNWVRNNIIEVDATYEEVSTDTSLIRTLLKYLGQGENP